MKEFFITIKCTQNVHHCEIDVYLLIGNGNYWPQRNCGQGNIFTPVCPFILFTGGKGSASVHAGMPPPGTDTPWGRPPQTRPPGPDTPQEQTPSPWTRPPQSRHPPAKQTLAYGLLVAGTHPTGMHSCSKCNWTMIFEKVQIL